MSFLINPYQVQPSGPAAASYSYVGYSFKYYNNNPNPYPAGIAVNDLVLWAHYDYYNSNAGDVGYTSLDVITVTSTDYRADWYKIMDSTPASVNLPLYAFGAFFAVRKSSGTPSIIGNNNNYSGSTTSISCAAIAGTGTLILRVQCEASVQTINTPAGWTRWDYQAIWIGGAYQYFGIYTKPNDGTGVTVTLNNTTNAHATLVLVN